MNENKTNYRAIRRDGTLNVTPPRGVSLKDLYHDLLRVSWAAFALLFVGFYALVNALFGWIYFLLPQDQFDGFIHLDGLQRFLESFFFSVQTFGTIGYGKVSPIGVAANFVVTAESCVGIFIVALMTGLIFARFAKPNSKIIFSDKAMIRSYDGVPCLMFRIANERQNHITEARVRVSLLIDDPVHHFRSFKELTLEHETSPIFSLSWTICHDITETSPFYGLTREQLIARNAEWVVTFSGTDTTLSQKLYAKYSYVTEEVYPDHDFVDVMLRRPDGTLEIMLDQFNEIVPIQS